MGNDQKKGKVQVVPPPSPAQIKTYIMVAQSKLALFRNKKIDSIKKKKKRNSKMFKRKQFRCSKS